LGNTYTETDGVSVVPNFELETVDYTGLDLFKVCLISIFPNLSFLVNPNGYSFITGMTFITLVWSISNRQLRLRRLCLT
jgi:hypothetical protein